MRDEGSTVTGLNYTLICEITIPPFNDTISVSEAFVTWTYPSGEIQRTFGNSVRLTFAPVTSDDDSVYTCTAHYLADGIASPQASYSHEFSVSKSLCFCIYTEICKLSNIFFMDIILEFVLYTVLEDLSVDVTGSGSGEAGSPYTLTCTVTLLHRASDSSVSIQWQGPHPHTVTTTTDISTNEVVSSQLLLDPLTLTDGGDYTCTATYTVGGKTSEGTGKNTTVIVISKLTPYKCASASL